MAKIQQKLLNSRLSVLDVSCTHDMGMLREGEEEGVGAGAVA